MNLSDSFSLRCVGLPQPCDIYVPGFEAFVKPIKVLLIEDSPTQSLVIQGMLREIKGSPFELDRADCLSTGLELLCADGIDVVLLDLTLPDSDGLGTFVRVQAHAPEVPIVVLTGLEDESLALAALHRGAHDYLVKSQVNANWLARSVRYAVERNRAEQRSAVPLKPYDVKIQGQLKITNSNEITIVQLLAKRILALTLLADIKSQLFRLVEHGSCRKLVLNFTDVEYLSNAALGVLLVLDKKLSANGGQLHLCNIRSEVYEHFVTSRLNKVFKISETQELALESF